MAWCPACLVGEGVDDLAPGRQGVGWMTWLIVGERGRKGKARNGVSSILFLLLFLARFFSRLF
jgi:hypothetical protein